MPTRRAAVRLGGGGGVAAAGFGGSGARLLTLVPGVGQAASAGDLGPSVGPVPTAVQVDLELLRVAPARLEVPTPDGSVLSAERSVFEDRGNGDLMWSGGQPGAGPGPASVRIQTPSASVRPGWRLAAPASRAPG